MSRRGAATDLYPAQVEPPADDLQVAGVLLNKVRLKRARQFVQAKLAEIAATNCGAN